jgi:hypothetical protein
MDISFDLRLQSSIKERNKMTKNNFEYNLFARGIYITMLWGTWGVVFVVPTYLVYYVTLLVFLGIGLKPFILRTGIYDLYQKILFERSERANLRMKKAYFLRNEKKLRRDKVRRDKMKRALSPKDY